MLGDIVTNNGNSNGGASTAVKQPRPVQHSNGYGASDVGPAHRPNNAIRPQPVQSIPAQPRPAQPQHQSPAPVKVVAQAAQPAPSVSAPLQSRPVSLTPAKKASKVPLILTIVGVVIFVGGVAALFVYALSA